MSFRTRLAAVLATPALAFAGLAPVPVAASTGPVTESGTFADGSTYLIEVPASWNGTLVLYSHGYVSPLGPNVAAPDAGDPITHDWMLANGYALAGSSYSRTGFAVKDALVDQQLTLQQFSSSIRHPKRTIAWGHSLGGLITTMLIQTHPAEFNAALPMCGVNGGPITAFNPGLDSVLALKTLLAPPNTPLDLVNIPSMGAAITDLQTAEAVVLGAQTTAQGRARTALVAALADLPGWFDPASPQPAPTDYASQEANQVQWLATVGLPAATVSRYELEQRAGGNFSWTDGVSFTGQLQNSVDLREVRAEYKAAGLDLSADLAALQSAPEISASPQALRYGRSITPTGDIGIPVLTLHTEGDGYVINENERLYGDRVQDSGDSGLLRQTYVHRAGHCAFTPAEQIEAFKTLVQRLDTGHWRDVNAADLNTGAIALGPQYNVTASGPTPPAFHTFHPSIPLRPELRQG